MAFRKFPEFSWSIRRHHAFSFCKRQYFYEYYKSYDGWNYDGSAGDDVTRRAYCLKYLEPLRLAYARVAANSIAHLIKKNTLSGENLMDSVKTGLHDVFVKERYQGNWIKKPKKNPFLMELFHHRGFKHGIARNTLVEVTRNIDALANIEKTTTFSFLKEEKGFEILNFYPEGKSMDFISFQGVNIWSSIPLAYKTEDEKIYVVRWDVLNTSDHMTYEEQMSLFGLAFYLHEKKEIPYEDIVLREERVLIGKTIEIKNLEKTRLLGRYTQYVGNSISEMRFLLKNENMEKNMPLPMKVFEREGEHKNCKRCLSCKYRTLCWATRG